MVVEGPVYACVVLSVRNQVEVVARVVSLGKTLLNKAKMQVSKDNKQVRMLPVRVRVQLAVHLAKL